MPKYICVTCGTQYPASDQPPAHCPICEDERQYIGPNGQQWTTLDALQQDRHMLIEPVEPNLYHLKPEPKIGIGQYAHLVQTPEGNVLWDCVPYLDDATIKAINDLGGIRAIAISHPHFHTLMSRVEPRLRRRADLRQRRESPRRGAAGRCYPVLGRQRAAALGRDHAGSLRRAL